MERVLIVLAAVACLAVILREVRNSTDSRSATKPNPFPYASTPLFSPAERSFLGVLEQALGERAKVFAKVRLGDLVTVRRGLDLSGRATAWNRIRQKHVDFVLCAPGDAATLGANDGS